MLNETQRSRAALRRAIGLSSRSSEADLAKMGGAEEPIGTLDDQSLFECVVLPSL